MTPGNNAPARLKSLELNGYKTFASKSTFEFAPTVTAVVGPNGSGKSNIADAIRWVLGEQSYSLLRGKRTEDMIFAGSEARARSGMASAAITFDNSDGWLPIEFTEVTISRRAYRDGQNEYLLNGQRVRLREVTELLSKCGLGQRTYIVIGQGLVDAVLSLKAEERRTLFEEAAGIGLYRLRREETLRRLDTTRRNLERAQDILTELGPRLRSLERQMRRARDYHQVRRDLRSTLRTWYGYQWYQLQDRLVRARERGEKEASDRDVLRRELEAVHQKLSTTREGIASLNAELHSFSQRASDLKARREALLRDSAVTRERSRWLTERLSRLEVEIGAREAELEAQMSRLESARETASRRQTALRESDAGRRQLEDPGDHGEDRPESAMARAAQARKAIEALAARQASWETRLRELAAREAGLQERRADLQRKLDEASGAVSQARVSSEAAHGASGEAGLKIQALDESERLLVGSLAQIDERLNEMAARRLDLQAQAARLEARLEVLRVDRESPVGEVMRALGLEEGGGQAALLGELAGRLRVRDEHRRAVEAALGVFARGAVFRSWEGIEAALSRLTRDPGRGPVPLLTAKVLRHQPRIEADAIPGVFGTAADLVDIEDEFRPLVEALLGRVVVVRDGDLARSMLAELPDDVRVVTLDGDVYFPAGQVLYAAADRTAGIAEVTEEVEGRLDGVHGELQGVIADWVILSQEREATEARLEELRADQVTAIQREREARLGVEEAALELNSAEERLTFLEEQARLLETEAREIADGRREMERSGEDFEAERERLEAALRAAESIAKPGQRDLLVAEADLHLEAARRALEEAEGRVAELGERVDGLNVELDERRQRKAMTGKELEATNQALSQMVDELSSLETQLHDLADETEPLQETLEEAEQNYAHLEAEEAHNRSVLHIVDQRHTAAQIELARRQEELISLGRRIQDDFGLVSFEYYDDAAIAQEPLPLEGLVERLPRVEVLPLELESQVSTLRSQLRRMGPVNPEAEREYEEVSQRVEFLTGQLEDLRQAEGQMEEVIAELDRLMTSEFRRTFEAVAAEFREAFTRLFDGGSARLVLAEGEDLTSTGIDIEARLPGRREQGLAMLSGGERSLTAIALIFALLKVSPTPFCVLDEVDAMLDEVNVVRFGEMLQELSRETQFLVITHNRQTIQAAAIVYGVSMGPDTASRVISLKLDEAEREIAT